MKSINWKKELFGDWHYHKEYKNGKQTVDIKLEGGLIPNLVSLAVLISIFVWLISLFAK